MNISDWTKNKTNHTKPIEIEMNGIFIVEMIRGTEYSSNRFSVPTPKKRRYHRN